MLVRLTSSVVAVLKIVSATVRYLALESRVAINPTVRKMNAVLLIRNAHPVALETSVIQMTTVLRVKFVAIVQAMHVTGKCAKSCFPKSCENRNHCEPTEFCCGMYPNKSCALNCSGADCLDDSDCATGGICCGLDENSICKCNESCLRKSCDYDSQCGSGTYCCDFDGYKMCHLNYWGEPCSSHSNCTSNDHCCGIQGYCVKFCLGADYEDDHQCVSRINIVVILCVALKTVILLKLIGP